MKIKSLFFVVIALLSLCFLLPLNSYAVFSIFSQHKSVKSSDGIVSIPVSEVNDGKAHYYVYKNGASQIKFFVVKSRDGVIRAAFDACDVCFTSKKGYSQDGEFMICNNCGRRFHSSRINVEKGGCNPAPLKRRIEGENLVIRVADISPGTRYF